MIVTQEQHDTVPSPRGGGISQLGQWMSQEEWDKAMNERFPGCMKGRKLLYIMLDYKETCTL